MILFLYMNDAIQPYKHKVDKNNARIYIFIIEFVCIICDW